MALADLLKDYTTQTGTTLDALSRERPVLVIFLRHFGWTFCREALADVAQRRAALDAKGTQVAFVHLGSEEDAAPFFASHGLPDVPRVSDPSAKLYEAFGLERAGVAEYLTPSVWGRFFQAVTHGVGIPVGDPMRMPGVFLLKDGEIVQAFRHKAVADRPDYDALSACPIG